MRASRAFNAVPALSSPSLVEAHSLSDPHVLSYDALLSPSSAKKNRRQKKKKDYDDFGDNWDGTEQMKVVLRQFEYYFSNQNLWRDQFIQNEMAKSPGRWVKVSEIAAFPRLKALTEDMSLILAAVRRSQKLELSHDELMVRRISPLPPYNPKKDAKRTVYVDKLPEGSTVKTVRKLFSKFGRVLYVTKCNPIGSSEPEAQVVGPPDANLPVQTCLVEFAKKEGAKKAVTMIQAYNQQLRSKAKEDKKDGLCSPMSSVESVLFSPTASTEHSFSPSHNEPWSISPSMSPVQHSVLASPVSPMPELSLLTPLKKPAGGLPITPAPVALVSSVSSMSATPRTPGSPGDDEDISDDDDDEGDSPGKEDVKDSDQSGKPKEIPMEPFAGLHVITKFSYLRKLGKIDHRGNLISSPSQQSRQAAVLSPAQPAIVSPYPYSPQPLMAQHQHHQHHQHQQPQHQYHQPHQHHQSRISPRVSPHPQRDVFNWRLPAKEGEPILQDFQETPKRRNSGLSRPRPPSAQKEQRPPSGCGSRDRSGSGSQAGPAFSSPVMDRNSLVRSDSSARMKQLEEENMRLRAQLEAAANALAGFSGLSSPVTSPRGDVARESGGSSSLEQSASKGNFSGSRSRGNSTDGSTARPRLFARRGSTSNSQRFARGPEDGNGFGKSPTAGRGRGINRVLSFDGGEPHSFAYAGGPLSPLGGHGRPVESA